MLAVLAVLCSRIQLRSSTVATRQPVSSGRPTSPINGGAPPTLLSHISMQHPQDYVILKYHKKGSGARFIRTFAPLTSFMYMRCFMGLRTLRVVILTYF